MTSRADAFLDKDRSNKDRSICRMAGLERGRRHHPNCHLSNPSRGCTCSPEVLQYVMLYCRVRPPCRTASRGIHLRAPMQNSSTARRGTALPAASAPARLPQTTRFEVLGAISFSHFLNDLIQSLIIAIYPLLKGEFLLSFAQIGAITLTYQICASVLQPLVGAYTDKHPQPYSLSMGMASTLIGLVTLALAPNYPCVLVAAAFVGAGSAVFHPESSRIARLASGGQHGLAQSIFQVGGNAGSAIGPLLAALIVIPHGQRSVAWFSIAAIAAIVVLYKVSAWYKRHHVDCPVAAKAHSRPAGPLSRQ